MDMNRANKMLSNHFSALTGHYGDDFKDMEFSKAIILENDNDSVMSHSVFKKIKFVTRHLITSDVTHSIVFDKNWYDRQ